MVGVGGGTRTRRRGAGIYALKPISGEPWKLAINKIVTCYARGT